MHLSGVQERLARLLIVFLYGVNTVRKSVCERTAFSRVPEINITKCENIKKKSVLSIWLILQNLLIDERTLLKITPMSRLIQ